MAKFIEKWQLAEIGFVDEEIDFMHWYSLKVGSERKTNEMLSVYIQDEMEKAPAPGKFKTHLSPIRDNYLDLREDLLADRDHFPGLNTDSVLKPSIKYSKTLWALNKYKAYFDRLPK